MTKEQDVKISDAEWEVMRVIWTKGYSTSPEIIKVLEKKMSWKPATIKTLIGRLVKKNMLSTESSGNKFIYRPLVSEARTVRSATETLFTHICAQKVGQTIVDLIMEAELTKADLDLIIQTAQAKMGEAVSSIPCNCIPGQCQCAEHKK